MLLIPFYFILDFKNTLNWIIKPFSKLQLACLSSNRFTLFFSWKVMIPSNAVSKNSNFCLCVSSRETSTNSSTGRRSKSRKKCWRLCSKKVRRYLKILRKIEFWRKRSYKSLSHNCTFLIRMRCNRWQNDLFMFNRYSHLILS